MESSFEQRNSSGREDANIARRLAEGAQLWPSRPAVIAPAGRTPQGKARYVQWSFAELEEEVARLTAGLLRMGVKPGHKLVLFVRFSREFIALTFAILRTGATIVLIDPGMGKTNIFECLKEVNPDGFVAIPLVHVIRLWKRKQYPQARFNVTVGRRWFWGGETYASLRSQLDRPVETKPAQPTDRAAIIFTSGSTGPPKGVVYEHGMFDAQVRLIQACYHIEPGDVDLPGFPLFGLFNAAMGVTTVIPDMDPTKPAEVDPGKILEAIDDHQVTQAFGSPAFWNRIGRYCETSGVTLPTIKRGLSAGGPVPVHVLTRMTAAFTRDGADLYTPYGATESLPVATIGGHEVLAQTAPKTAVGRGTCVGRCFPGVDVKIIAIGSQPISSINEAVELPQGEIGEIIVRSPSVTREYFNRPEATALAKIPDSNDGSSFWHRIGDVGYFDEEGLLWFCGRKAHIVDSVAGRMFSVCCEAIFNEHPRIYRSALVGLGERPSQRPCIVVEPESGDFPDNEADRQKLIDELLNLGKANKLTESIEVVLIHRSLPVDTRHNVKINREALAVWAASQFRHSF